MVVKDKRPVPNEQNVEVFVRALAPPNDKLFKLFTEAPGTTEFSLDAHFPYDNDSIKPQSDPEPPTLYFGDQLVTKNSYLTKAA